MNQKRILVFGTFDKLHAGHLFFLKQAKACGTQLIVGVARDSQTKLLKGTVTENSEKVRKEKIDALKFVYESFLCDKELGGYQILQKARPDMVVVGHDQKDLAVSLMAWMKKNDSYLPIQQIKKL